jgi:hypothetical protein
MTQDTRSRRSRARSTGCFRSVAGEEFELPAVEAEKPKIVEMMTALEASVVGGEGAPRQFVCSLLCHAASRKGSLLGRLPPADLGGDRCGFRDDARPETDPAQMGAVATGSPHRRRRRASDKQHERQPSALEGQGPAGGNPTELSSGSCGWSVRAGTSSCRGSALSLR